MVSLLKFIFRLTGGIFGSTYAFYSLVTDLRETVGQLKRLGTYHLL